MRSRDGNNYRLLTVSLILFNSLVLYASEYLISYRYVVKNLVLHNESLLISKSMKHCSGNSSNYIEIPHKDSKNLTQIINTNKDEFIDYIHKLGLNVEHEEVSLNAKYSSTTILTLKTTCFKVDFNDYFVKISALK